MRKWGPGAQPARGLEDCPWGGWDEFSRGPVALRPEEGHHTDTPETGMGGVFSAWVSFSQPVLHAKSFLPATCFPQGCLSPEA